MRSTDARRQVEQWLATLDRSANSPAAVPSAAQAWATLRHEVALLTGEVRPARR